MSTPSTSPAANEEPFTLTPPASPADATLPGGPQADAPAGAVERVFLQRGRRIAGPSELALLVRAVPFRGGTSVQVELRDPESTGGAQRALSVIVEPSLLITDDEFGFANPQWSELVLARLCEYANQLYRDRVALRTGEEFIGERIEYSDPDEGIALLRARGCEIHDADAIRKLIAADPGPLFYGSVDLDEHGHDWAHGGGRWIERIQRRALDAGALSEPPETSRS
jgi:hypothetical protein